MNFKTDHNLITELKSKVTLERQTTAEILSLLRTVEHRRLYLSLGYSSLFRFCTEFLGYNEASAQRRISAMRLIHEIRRHTPSIAVKIESKLTSGAINLTQLALTQKAFKKMGVTTGAGKNAPTDTSQKIKFLAEIENKSTRATEKLISAKLNLGSPTRMVTLKLETIELIEKFIGLSAHKNPHADYDLAISQSLSIAMTKINPLLSPPKRVGYCAENSRLAGKTLRHKIWARYGGRCAFTSPITGKRCGSQFKLEVDHCKPFALGGETVDENLQLLCRAHNQYKS